MTNTTTNEIQTKKAYCHTHETIGEHGCRCETSRGRRVCNWECENCWHIIVTATDHADDCKGQTIAAPISPGTSTPNEISIIERQRRLYDDTEFLGLEDEMAQGYGPDLGHSKNWLNEGYGPDLGHSKNPLNENL